MCTKYALNNYVTEHFSKHKGTVTSNKEIHAQINKQSVLTGFSLHQLTRMGTYNFCLIALTLKYIRLTYLTGRYSILD